MYQAILPSANSLIKCLVIFNMPFTLVKGLLDAVLCLLIYCLLYTSHWIFQRRVFLRGILQRWIFQCR